MRAVRLELEAELVFVENEIQFARQIVEDGKGDLKILLDCQFLLE